MANNPTDEQILATISGTNASTRTQLMTYVIRNTMAGKGFKGLKTDFVRRRLMAMERAGIVERVPSCYATQICWQRVTPPASQEVLAVLWEWTDGEFAGSRYWSCHSVGGDGRIQQWQEIGARPLGAAVVTVTEGEGLHLLTTTPAQEGGEA